MPTCLFKFVSRKVGRTGNNRISRSESRHANVPSQIRIEEIRAKKEWSSPKERSGHANVPGEERETSRVKWNKRPTRIEK